MRRFPNSSTRINCASSGGSTDARCRRCAARLQHGEARDQRGLAVRALCFGRGLGVGRAPAAPVLRSQCRCNCAQRLRAHAHSHQQAWWQGSVLFQSSGVHKNESATRRSSRTPRTFLPRPPQKQSISQAVGQTHTRRDHENVPLARARRMRPSPAPTTPLRAVTRGVTASAARESCRGGEGIIP